MHIYKTVYIVYIVYIQKVIGDVDENNFKNNSDFPIYEQIKQQVKQNILKGHVAPGEHLPSMRELAKDLQVSLITTKRAYEDLEKDGFVTTIRGKGTFVKEQDSSILKETILPLKIWLKNWLMKRKPSKCHLRNFKIF